MDFPITDLMDEDACYAKLVQWLHPQGFSLARDAAGTMPWPSTAAAVPRSWTTAAGHCRRVFNTFTGTSLYGAKRPPAELVLILRGFAQGVPTAQLARDRSELLKLRHRTQGAASRGRDRAPLGDASTEADEAYQNAGEKGVPHDDPDDPPRRRANKVRGHGTWENDRPPVCGVVGRESGQVRLTVAEHSDGETSRGVVGDATAPKAMVYTDEWGGYNGLKGMDRGHAAVCHNRGEWARDDDGDGVREVHDDTPEGPWTGPRNFLRRSRGVSKKYLARYVAMFEWDYNVKRATPGFLGAMLGVRPTTICPS